MVSTRQATITIDEVADKLRALLPDVTIAHDDNTITALMTIEGKDHGVRLYPTEAFMDDDAICAIARLLDSVFTKTKEKHGI